jgi:Delta3,5-Delta2,4-dienoyl-CoA isomerase
LFNHERCANYRELVYTARKLPAAEALSCGLVSKVLPDAQQLQSAALEMASLIASKSPVAVQGSKINLNYAQDHTTADALHFQAVWNGAMLQSTDIATSVRAQMKRVAPEFKDL